MRNITLSADEKLIEAARERAGAERTTLNEQFRRWLADYARHRERVRSYDEAMAQLRGKEIVDRFSRPISMFDGIDLRANRADGDDLLGGRLRIPDAPHRRLRAGGPV